MNKKQKILIAGAALFAALFLFSGFMLYREYADSKQSADAFESLASLVLEEPTRRSSQTARWTHPATAQKKPNRR